MLHDEPLINVSSYNYAAKNDALASGHELGTQGLSGEVDRK